MRESAEYHAQWRANRKEMGLCPRCGQEDAYTMAGRYYCAECAEKAMESQRRHPKSEEQKKQKALTDKIRKEKKIAEGYCVRCVTRKPAAGYRTCPVCIAKTKERYQRNQDPEINWPRGANGICYICNKTPAAPGYKVCLECRNQNAVNAKKADNSHHIWHNCNSLDIYRARYFYIRDLKRSHDRN